MSQKLRVGVLLESLTIPAWSFEMFDRIQRGDYAEIVVIITGQTDPTGAQTEQQTALYRLFDKLERKVVKLAHDPFVDKDSRALFPQVPVVHAQFHITGESDQIDDAALATIDTYNLDLLFTLRVRRLSGQLLTLPLYGVWAYHHGDYRTNRGEPAGFWEVIDGHPVTGITLKQLSEDPDADAILARSYSATNTPFAHRNRYNYYWKSATMLPRALERLATMGGAVYFAQAQEKNKTLSVYDRKPYHVPNNWEFLRRYPAYLARYMWGKLYRLATKEQWVLFYDLRQEFSTVFWRYRPLLPPKDRFWADPHIVYMDNKYYIFLEELLFEDYKGRISVIEMDHEGNYGASRLVLERPYHLSYPFVFQYDDTYYMIPETADNRTIELYEATQFPYEWTHKADIMTDVAAFDTTLHYHNGLWWMFTTFREEIVGLPCDDLFLFYSDDPLSGHWQPHPLNPIVSDVRRARPAGCLFEHNGDLYRPAQDDSKLYGYGIRLNRINTLTQDEYDEEEIDFIEPRWQSSLLGIHTINHRAGLTIIDAFRRIPKL